MCGQAPGECVEHSPGPTVLLALSRQLGTRNFQRFLAPKSAFWLHETSGPRSANRKTDAIQIRLSPEEKRKFDRLVVARQQELRSEGVDVTGPMVIRWLITRELIARGFDKDEPAVPVAKKTPRGKS